MKSSSVAINQATKASTNGPHFALAYGWALTCIADPGLKGRVQAILVAARKVTGATDEDVARQLAEPTKKLRKIALDFPEVLESLLVIIESGGNEPRSLGSFCLVVEVVASLITRDRLDRAQTARAVRGIVATWCDIVEQSLCDGMEADFAMRILRSIDAPLFHVKDTTPGLIFEGCLARLYRSPRSDVIGFSEWWVTNAELNRLESLCEEADFDGMWTSDGPMGLRRTMVECSDLSTDPEIYEE